MSFLYQYLFPTQPDIMQQKLQFLESGFLQPTSTSTINTISSDTGVTLTVEQVILGKFLKRIGTGGNVSDTTPSAAEIVQFILPYISPFILESGFYFDISIFNNRTDNSTVSLILGSGITSSSSISFLPNTITTIRIFITNVESGSETIYCSVLGN